MIKQNHIPWPNINNFHNLRRIVLKTTDYVETIDYKAKIKIHGTNAGIIINKDNIFPMSRSQIISVENDNQGFSNWVNSKEKYFMSLFKGDQIVIFGEWCGPGIQKGVAINKIKNKVFVIFAILKSNEFIYEPQQIKDFLGNEFHEDIHVLPWFDTGRIYTINWINPGNVVDIININVLEVEEQDPWVKSIFDISGIGEGLVFYPMVKNYLQFKEFVFKAKGEKHAVLSKTKPAQINATITNNIKEFSDLVLTLPRLEQGVKISNNDNLDFDMKNIGKFLKFINSDIIKECQSELIASLLNERVILKSISNNARDWYIEQSKKII